LLPLSHPSQSHQTAKHTLSPSLSTTSMDIGSTILLNSTTTPEVSSFSSQDTIISPPKASHPIHYSTSLLSLGSPHSNSHPWCSLYFHPKMITTFPPSTNSTATSIVTMITSSHSPTRWEYVKWYWEWSTISCYYSVIHRDLYHWDNLLSLVKIHVSQLSTKCSHFHHLILDPSAHLLFPSVILINYYYG
jgi:hypothetical protein